ncbi:MAG: hypothetical protein NVS2B3_05110 [Vulcanimicrobiaceae bacterium]
MLTSPRTRLALFALASAASLGSIANAEDSAAVQPPNLPRCTEADVALVGRLDSARNVAGESFTFKLLRRVPARGPWPAIPVGTRGFGVIAYADHAHGSGDPGRIVVEPRFLRLPSGTHVPVMADPQLGESFVQGQTRNVNGALAFVPGFGLAVEGYNALHRGREIVIENGTAFRIVLGDELALGDCFVPPPSAPDVR